MHTKTHTYTYKYACAHAHTHACMRTCMHTHTRIYTQNYKHRYTQMCMCKCMHVPHIHMHALMHTCTCMQANMHVHTPIHTCAHSYIHTCTHTHTHTHTWHQVGAGNTAHPNCLAAQVPSVQVSWQTAPSPCCILPFSAHHPDVGIPMVPHARRVQREPTDEGRSCSQTDPPSGPTLSTAVLANLSEMNITL